MRRTLSIAHPSHVLRRALSVACAAACACAPRFGPAPAAAPDAAHGQRPLTEELHPGVLRAAGLAPLDSTPLPAGTREVRIWIGGGLGYPQQLYRIVDRRGRVSGELVLHWPAGPLDSPIGDAPGQGFADLVRRKHRGACDHFRRSETAEVCRARFTRQPDWADVLRRAEAEGLWTLQDPRTLPSDGIIVFDGWGIAVELRDGGAYRAYDYANPQAHPRWRDAPHAIAIARMLNDVSARMRRPDVVRVYRGVTTGAYQSEIRLCDGRTAWEFHDALSSLARRDSIALPPPGDGGRYYVEVDGEATPEWLARKWDSRFPRVLEPHHLRAVKPWTGRECR